MIARIGADVRMQNPAYPRVSPFLLPPFSHLPQVHASADTLKLITFDADGTLYADGAHMEQDNQMIAHIINLMRSNVQVEPDGVCWGGVSNTFRRVLGIKDGAVQLSNAVPSEDILFLQL